MQVMGIILGLLSVVLIVAPVGAVVVMYQDNLQALVIPPEINGLITGEGSSLFLINDTSDGDGSAITNIIIPTFVSADIDNDANTFIVVMDVTNNVNYTFVLNTFSTDVKTTLDNYPLVTVNLVNPPVNLTPGGTSRVTIVGAWTQDTETYFLQKYAGASSVSVQLENTNIDVNGITVTLSQPIAVDVPLTLEG